MALAELTAHLHSREDVGGAFRRAMRTFTGTVSLITTCTDDGEWRGMAATAVSSVSVDPPTCLICVNRNTTIYPALMASQRFCINGMHQEHSALIASFASSELREKRFQNGSWQRWDNGIPYLEDAQSNIFCDVFNVLPVGTHDVFFGLVSDVRVRHDHDPLLYGNGAYMGQVAL